MAVRITGSFSPANDAYEFRVWNGRREEKATISGRVLRALQRSPERLCEIIAAELEHATLRLTNDEG